ncbi:MAG: hypothetical protein JXQ74_01585 [Alphaproteobacteria bacterium]|nr:hypothetical protein [Alphaproteobacteria bacterium]
MKLLLSLIVSSVLLTGCMQSQPEQQPAPQKSNLTYGTVKSQIVKGQTTQTEVIQMLGSPNMVSKTKGGDEVWTYSKQSYDSSSASSAYGVGLIFAGFSGGKSNRSSTVSTFDLMITFDKNDVVKDYSVVSSQY